MLLILTNKEDHTADYVIVELRRRGLPYMRFNTEDFPKIVGLSWEFCDGKPNGIIRIKNRTVHLDSVKRIWLRRPLSPVFADDLSPRDREFASGEAKEALAGVLRTMDSFWVSHPDAIRSANNKLRQLTVAQALGMVVPRTLVTNDPRRVIEFFRNCDSDMVVKTIKSAQVGEGAAAGLVYTNRVTADDLKSVSGVEVTPCLFQQYIPKEFEIRITVIGNRVLTAAIFSQETKLGRDDWRRGQGDDMRVEQYELPKEMEQLCVRYVKKFGLVFGAIDMVVTPSGEYVFLELNPNGQWAWLEPLTGLHLRDAMIGLLTENHCGEI